MSSSSINSLLDLLLRSLVCTSIQAVIPILAILINKLVVGYSAVGSVLCDDAFSWCSSFGCFKLRVDSLKGTLALSLAISKVENKKILF